MKRLRSEVGVFPNRRRFQAIQGNRLARAAKIPGSLLRLRCEGSFQPA